MKSIAERIKLARERVKLNQSELARAVGVSPQSVQLWEVGASAPNRNRIERVAHVLGVSVADLLSENADFQPLPTPPENADHSALTERIDVLTRAIKELTDAVTLALIEFRAVEDARREHAKPRDSIPMTVMDGWAGDGDRFEARDDKNLKNK